MSALADKLIDFALLQVGWFACVLGGAAGHGWIGPVSAAGLIAIHVLLLTPAGPGRSAEIQNVIIFGLLGAVLDTVQTHLGVFCFDDRSFEVLGLPLWMTALWFLFPILFNTTIDWLRGRVVLAALFGLIGGPVAYAGGEALGALELGSDRTASLASIGVVWGIYTPLALRLARRGPR